MDSLAPSSEIEQSFTVNYFELKNVILPTNFKGQNVCQGRLGWLESREETKEIYPLKDEAEEMGKEKGCGGLTMAEHKVPTKPVCLSPSSAEQGRENLLKGVLFCPFDVFMWQGLYALFTFAQM